MSVLQKRSFSLSGHRTSIALEKEFWCVLRHKANREASSLAAFVATIDAQRLPEHSLASLLRLIALRHAASHGMVVFEELYSAASSEMIGR
ncbi:aryl-sulfate sulfotransferase [Saccharibacter sp. 17.LH.SD]|uniref:ribbon-helix-helix domain-containing protein n=1 Tax=Saccharibacter sp. 17.LH.SD TaxID=2689393 RepID=UPI001368C196|nr:ribbon-helix-helix domain-containing protein [Saccharibacter sp. 17.LH.SD]MXV44902.1 aryl-sulfate sulfotransferase [Saccharibacter sp. 17.LH.SD]